MRREDCTPGLVVRYSDGYLLSTSGITDDERAARFTLANPCPTKRSRKGKPSCWACWAGSVPVVGGDHIHPSNLEPVR